MSLNSGAGGVAGAFWGGWVVLRSSRLLRMLRSEGMMLIYLADSGGSGRFVCVIVGCKVRDEGGLSGIHVGLRMNDIKNNHNGRQWLCRRQSTSTG